MAEDFGNMAASETPDFYDDLELTLAECWRLVLHGAQDRQAEAHTPAVATVGLDGAPAVRTVVLRAADSQTRTIAFHTDARSPKLAEIRRNPECSVLLYERSWKAQARLRGQASIHLDDAIAAAAWARTAEMSKLCYQVTTAPGASIGTPADAVFDAVKTNDGRDNFCCVTIDVRDIEWLYLHHLGHRRARFAWDGAAWRKTWLAP